MDLAGLVIGKHAHDPVKLAGTFFFEEEFERCFVFSK